MNHGKNICNQLKAVRKCIAEENNIHLEMEECTYKGECRGTCPRCEAEVRFLENALADRLKLGKVATIAGLALGLAATTAQAQAPVSTIPTTPQDTDTTHKVIANGVLKGIVVEAKTNEPIPFCNVVVKQDGKQVHGGTTDFDGIYTIKPIPSGEYTIEVSTIGFHKFVREGIQVKPTGFTVYDVSLDPSPVVQGVQGIIVIEESSPVLDGGAVIGEVEPILLGTPASQAVPAIQIGGIEEDMMPANPPVQRIEKDGVKVIVR